MKASTNKNALPVGMVLGPSTVTTTTMQTRSLTRILQSKLDEAYFVFRQLPRQLHSAAKRIGLLTLRDRMLTRARALLERSEQLMRAMRNWQGRKPLPCTCEDLSTELNELRYAVKSQPPERWLASTTVRIANRLYTMVRDRLVRARRIAVQINEEQLAADIHALLEEEQRSDDELVKALGSGSAQG